MTSRSTAYRKRPIRPPLRCACCSRTMTEAEGSDRLMAPLEVPAGATGVEIEDEQEAEPVRIAHNPKQPTEREIEDHRTDHTPYRSWCKWCVMARGRGAPHCSAHGSRVPRIGVDYFYITKGGV